MQFGIRGEKKARHSLGEVTSQLVQHGSYRNSKGTRESIIQRLSKANPGIYTHGRWKK